MTRCRRVAPDVWLGFARCSLGADPGARGRRWIRDREAADRAVAAVLEASGLAPGACATSRSHTRGIGAALAAPPGTRVGVDLVDIARVGRRHAEAILGKEEWQALAPYAPVRPALAWALKEAAAKADGDPARRFPDGLRIAAGAGGLTVEVVESGMPGFTSGWGLLDGFLYAWVRGAGQCRPRSAPAGPSPPLASARPGGPRHHQ